MKVLRNWIIEQPVGNQEGTFKTRSKNLINTQALGESSGIRTRDTHIKSVVLYQLS